MAGSPIDGINALPAETLARELRACCASERWIATVAAARPYADTASLLRISDEAFESLDKNDWLEAFAPAADREPQGGDAGTLEATRVALRLYRERFGYPFIVGVEQPGADELLMRVRIRLGLESTAQMRATRYEQSRLTRGRLQRLVDRLHS